MARQLSACRLQLPASPSSSPAAAKLHPSPGEFQEEPDAFHVTRSLVTVRFFVAAHVGRVVCADWRYDFFRSTRTACLRAAAMPGEGYIWTPGYWAYDYDYNDNYWVPGTWVLAPQVGYLWTPPYWGGPSWSFRATEARRWAQEFTT